jgi:hypothetical protein
MWELWRESTAEVREKWRDIANVVREGNALEAPDELPEILQIVFWFGALNGTAREGAGRHAGLGNFLPESTVDALLRPEGSARRQDHVRASA